MNTTQAMDEAIFWIYNFGGIFSVSIFSIIGNSLVIQAMMKNNYGVPLGIRRRRRLRTPSNYFLFSLAVSDLLLGVIYPIYNVSHVKTDAIQHSLGLWIPCDIVITTTLGLQYNASFHLVGITITRYISIRDPLKFPLRVTHKRALVAVVTTWVVIMSIAFGIYIRQKPHDFDNDCRYEMILEHYDIIIITSVFVLLPLLIMTTLYIHMGIIARKQIRNIASQQVICGYYSGMTLKALVLRREMRMLKMVAMLAGYFAFAWLPFVVYEFYCSIYDTEVDRWIRVTVRIILHSNTAINVTIYAGRLRDFREAIKSNVRDTVRACASRSEY